MQNRPFSVCNDSSIDNGIKMMNLVFVTIFDPNNLLEVYTSFMVSVLPQW